MHNITKLDYLKTEVDIYYSFQHMLASATVGVKMFL